MYKIKEIYYTIQGEGYHTGRPAIFLRFSGCNLWTGQEKDRFNAVCYWCDTDFVGTNGINGGKYYLDNLEKTILSLWPKNESENPYVVCTGGEPLLQMNDEIINMIHKAGFEIGLETNGTIIPPVGIDWLCVSPKANTELLLIEGNELKIVFPQIGVNPKEYEKFDFNHFFIQPMDGENLHRNTRKAKEFISLNPKWKLSIQTHKILGIP
ncbi:MAG: 7-carboxy-7-deazaguanine synthase [Candidatus Marinimicrobia bacterium]|nr:7-carboxy-7-deazaguanine synthase [Candidatus Neomarinimicrobiota bacterium]|tara:strand:+ start:4246 stop:4875 length:630 start_codon:yes stop_codon:yes gene_type:complete